MPKVGENGEFDASDIKEYREVKKGFTYFQNGDVLFAKITPCMENGKGAIARNLKNGIGFGSTEFHVLRPIPDVVLGEWLYYLLSWTDFRKEAEKNMTGSAGQKRVPKSFLENYQVVVPSLDIQEKQVNIFKNLDLLISLRKQQLSKLDELVKSRFVELFGDPVKNDMGWKTTSLKNATSKIGSGATPKGGKESYQAEGITLIRSMNVHDGRFEYKDLAHITDEQAKQLDNVAIEENDVFINITGASVARSCIVPKHILPARVNQHVAIIRCITSMLNPVFANNMFLNHSFKEQLLDIGETGGATRQAITKQQLESLEVILPPLELQNQFADFVEQIDKSKFEIQKSLEKLETLKKALMQKYFG
ncbi:MAG: restriction endonuclease subunit S [Clostridia bacterium]|nr:restriction endonuclease subunit S [Clostridia bacterium]